MERALTRIFGPDRLRCNACNHLKKWHHPADETVVSDGKPYCAMCYERFGARTYEGKVGQHHEFQ